MYWNLSMTNSLATESATHFFPEHFHFILIQKEGDCMLNINQHSSIHSSQGFLANSSKEQKNQDLI